MKRSPLLLLCLAVSACVGGRPPEDFRTPAYAGPDAAVVTVRRESAIFLGVGGLMVVTIDGAPMAQLRAGDQAGFAVEPGQRIVGLECAGRADTLLGHEAQMPLDLKAGRHYGLLVRTGADSPCQILLRSAS